MDQELVYYMALCCCLFGLGIEIPGLKQSLEGDRKPVRYGSRVRPKKKESPSIQTATDDTENTHCKDAEYHSTSEEQGQ